MQQNPLFHLLVKGVIFSGSATLSARPETFAKQYKKQEVKMNYSIFNERLSELSNGTASVIAELVAASSEDIPSPDAVSGRLLNPGSTAIVPSEMKVYILDADGLWTDWSTGEKLTDEETPDA